MSVEGLCSQDVLPLVDPEASPEDWFASGLSKDWQRAKRICEACPVMTACRQYALDEGIPDGIFGGMTASERREAWGPAGPPKDHLAGLYSQRDALLARNQRALSNDETEEVA